MIIAALYGGLGNQVFQYAAARAVALRSCQDLALDLSWFTAENTSQQQRPYLLDKFQIQATIASAVDLAPFKTMSTDAPKGQRPDFTKQRIIKEESFAFQGRLRNEQGDAYLHGYWQSEKYFLDFAAQIRSDLRIREVRSTESQPLKSLNRSQPSVAVHVRRGDFANDPKTRALHGLCTLEYYRNATALLMECLESPRFFVFSDDPDWCKSNLILPADTEYIGNSDPADPTIDFNLMTQCEHFVNANSSFSWWAAWLAENPNKIVIAPRNLVTGGWLDTKDYFPLRWVQL